MWMELVGTWSGFLSLVVIVLSAIAIPLGVIWALMRQYKGPIERAHEPHTLQTASHTDWHSRRYEH